MAKKKKINNINWKGTIGVYVLGFIVLSALAILPNLSQISIVRVITQLATTAVLLISLALYVYFSDRECMERISKSVAMFTTMVLSYLAVQLACLWKWGIYVVPFALCTLVLSLIVSVKVGFFANFVIIMLCFNQFVNWQNDATLASEQVFYLLFGGVTEAVFASYILGKHYRRSRYLGVGVLLGIVSAVSETISYMMFLDDLSQWSWQDIGVKFGCAAASGMVGVMLMFVLVPLFERVFNVVSVFRFSEIASSDTPLMRKLYEKAPGTYNHSLSVAIYVEACATAIGESAVEARACAYYHDIGKMRNPQYFSENQFSGVNPHDNMTPEASVNIIKAHTVNGLALAKEYGLPKEVQDAIMQHHGTMPLKYFYLKAKKYTDGDLPYDGYCYDGPKPTSKIAAMLMICDASEAALRAHGDRTNAEKIVDGIVAERLAFDQFSNCDITMKEIDIIKSTIITTFSGIRHKRVKYPEIVLEGDNK